MGGMPSPTVELVREALAKVNDPEIKRPITDLGMVDDVIVDGSSITAKILLTVAGCPMKERLTGDVTKAIAAVAPDAQISVDLGVMTDEQRKEMQTNLRGGKSQKEIPFNQAGSLTKVFAIASGKGGVGKSSVTVNLAIAMANRGLKVGLIDADIYGHSIPDMLGVGDSRPTQVEDMIMPVPVETPSGTDIRVISIGMLKPRKDQVVAWRGPMLDRALVQMLSDVFWGDLDVLLLDLPPGTGDMAISLGQHLPNAEVVVVTTPQAGRGKRRRARRHDGVDAAPAGRRRRREHVVPRHRRRHQRLEIFGSGGAQQVAATLASASATTCRSSAKSRSTRSCAKAATPARRSSRLTRTPRRPRSLQEVADQLTGRSRGLAGMQLGLSPAGR